MTIWRVKRKQDCHSRRSSSVIVDQHAIFNESVKVSMEEAMKEENSAHWGARAIQESLRSLGNKGAPAERRLR